MSHSNINRSRPSRTMPLDVGVIHLVGIGGIGMSGIAEILHNLGYKVSGSDVAESGNTERLRGMGITVHIGHRAENIEGTGVVVRSTAVPMTNPEVLAAREKRIPVVKRSEMLAELTRLKSTVAVAGTHGKTTTTSLVASMFEEANLQPTVINGGIINAQGTNAYLGSGDWLVAEADESDGTFIKIPSTVGIVTNIDPEHLNYWGTFDALREGFRTFVENLPFYGLGVLCVDHPEVRALLERISDRRIITYALDVDADVRAVNIRTGAGGKYVYDVELSELVTGAGKRIIKDVSLNIPGRHNVQNSLSAIAVALEIGISDEVIKRALAKFAGVKRRFTYTGNWQGVTVIDDYGHHPAEIKATLKAARDVTDSENKGGRVLAVVQPHRYTRLEDLFKEFCACFGDADKVIVSEVYAAGEKPIAGVDRDALVQGIIAQGKEAFALESPEALAGLVAAHARSGDYVICLGAGSITKWAASLPSELAALKKGAA